MCRIILIVFAITLTNCDSQNGSYWFREVDKGNVTLVPIRINKGHVEGDSFYFVYVKENRDTTCFVLSSREDGLNYFIEDSDTTRLALKDQRTYHIGDKEHEVYKLYGNEKEADGLLVYFWSPEFGILLSSIPNWRESRLLLCNETKDECEAIQTLQQLIMTDFFSLVEPRSEIDFVEPEVEN